MGFSYRKSFRAGPFRATLSKSGVSYSVGVKGARITRRANGRVQATVSAPGTGLRYTTTSTKATRGRQDKATTPRAARPVRQGGPSTGLDVSMNFNGYGMSIALHPRGIEIHRSLIRRAAGRPERQAILWSEIVDIEAVKPSFLRGLGYIHILTSSDPNRLAAPGAPRAVHAASMNPNTVMFSNLPGGMREFRRLVEALARSARPSR